MWIELKWSLTGCVHIVRLWNGVWLDVCILWGFEMEFDWMRVCFECVWQEMEFDWMRVCFECVWEEMMKVLKRCWGSKWCFAAGYAQITSCYACALRATASQGARVFLWIYIGLHLFTLVYIGLHWNITRFTLVYTGLHRFTLEHYEIYIGLHWFTLVH